MIGRGADLVRVPIDAPVHSDSFDCLEHADKVSLRGMGYFGFSNFVGYLFGFKPLEVKDSGLIQRVVDGASEKPFIDRLPEDFASRYLEVFEQQNDLAGSWLSMGHFNRFDYYHFEPLMRDLINDIAGFCRAALEQEQVIYFRQVF